MNIGNFFKSIAGIISALTLIVVIVTVLSDILCLRKTQQAEPASLSVSKENFVDKLHALENRGLKIIAIEPINNNIIKVSYLNENALTGHYSNKNLLPFTLISTAISFIMYFIGFYVGEYEI